MPNLAVKRDCAKARSPLLLRWVSHTMRTFILSSIISGALCVMPTEFVAAAGDGIVPSYTMEEIYERAAAFKQVQNKNKIPNGRTAQLELAMKAAEFRGYVAGILDLQTTERLVECSKRNPLGLTAARAASMLTSVPLDRGGLPGYSVLISIYAACDESIWTKKRQ